MKDGCEYDPAQALCLPDAISAARLSPYLRNYEGNQAYALRLYMWNVSLSSAFWGPISLIEVAFRNRVQQQLNAHQMTITGKRLQAILLPREAKKYQKDVEHLPEGYSEDDAVAALSFGFWTGLCGQGRWRDREHDYTALLWNQAGVREVFSNREGIERGQIHADLDSLRKLRNRIARHEPIWKRNIQEHLNRVERLAAWMDTDLAAYIELNQRVNAVLEQKQDAITYGNCPL